MQQYVGEIDIFLIVCLEITVNLHMRDILNFVGYSGYFKLFLR